MRVNYSHSGWGKRAVLSAAAFCAAATAAHAQTVTGYGTGFDGTDTVNGAATTVTYNSPAATATDPLSGQNNWTTNDPVVASTVGTTQVVGQSDFVGTLTPTGYFTGQNGVLGGVYRTTAPTTGAPDVVPSTASGGVVSLAHTVSGGNNSLLTLDVDFAVINSVNFAAKDTFSFSLRNTTGTLVSINFSPSTTSTTADTVTGTSGGVTTASTNGVTFNTTYHLKLTLNLAAKTYQAGINSTATPGVVDNFAGSTSGAPITGVQVTQFATLWTLQNTTGVANGGYQNAGDNYIVFDNLAVTVPEPSTYAMLALGLVGLGGMLRLRRQQA